MWMIRTRLSRTTCSTGQGPYLLLAEREFVLQQNNRWPGRSPAVFLVWSIYRYTLYFIRPKCYGRRIAHLSGGGPFSLFLSIFSEICRLRAAHTGAVKESHNTIRSFITFFSYGLSLVCPNQRKSNGVVFNLWFCFMSAIFFHCCLVPKSRYRPGVVFLLMFLISVVLQVVPVLLFPHYAVKTQSFRFLPI